MCKQARVARGEISTVPARVTTAAAAAEAAAAAAAAPDAVVSPPEVDGAAPLPKKKKKRKVWILQAAWLLLAGRDMNQSRGLTVTVLRSRFGSVLDPVQS